MFDFYPNTFTDKQGEMDFIKTETSTGWGMSSHEVGDETTLSMLGFLHFR